MVKPQTIKYFLWAGCVFSVLIFAMYSYTHVPRLTEGYAAYYKFSRVLVEGKNIGALYDSTALNNPIYDYGIKKYDVLFNPPTSALALAPFAYMNAYDARISWSIVLIIAFLCAIYVLFRIYSVSWRTNVGIGLLALLFVWYPSYINVRFAQIYFLLLFLFAISLYGIKNRRPFLTAIPIALALLLKGYGVVPLLWLLYNKRWREAAISIGFVVIAIAATLPLLGTDSWIAFYNTVFLNLGKMPCEAQVAYQDINGFMMHLFLYNKDWSPFPIFVLPETVVFSISAILNISAIGATIALSSKTRNNVLSYALAIAVGVITSPLSFEHHYVLFLPLVIGLIAEFSDKDVHTPPNKTTILLLAAILLMALPLHYADLQTASAPLILLAYPKLYAGLAILLITLTSRRLINAPAG
ncbi:MAG TPA: glycosyltransferase family 87 protein [Candidatus Kapabacteria bacterium]|nr:glycosyltransferase family 87 protein [Candidatus Kapabacteria bacterium]